MSTTNTNTTATTTTKRSPADVARALQPLVAAYMQNKEREDEMLESLEALRQERSELVVQIAGVAGDNKKLNINGMQCSIVLGGGKNKDANFIRFPSKDNSKPEDVVSINTNG